MLRTRLTQMRAHAGRLVAAAVAIMIATTLVAAFMVAAGVLEKTAFNAVSVSHANADVILEEPYQGFSTEMVEQIRRQPEAAGADGRFVVHTVIRAGGRSDSPTVAPLPETPELRIELDEGRYPEARGEILVSHEIAERLDLDLGSSVELLDTSADVGLAGRSGGPGGQPADGLTVTGTFIHPGAAFDHNVPGMFGRAAEVELWSGHTTVRYERVIALASPGTSAEELRTALEPLADQVGTVVYTADEYARIMTARFTADSYILAAVLAALVGVALVVAGLVIANTFAVIVAQRTRELALLRCVGATRRQVRNGVLVEAGGLGVAASLAGIAAGIGLAQITIMVLRAVLDFPWFPERPEVSVLALLIPLVVGVTVTILAALAPARAATRVSPLAALRPPEPGGIGRGTSVRRLAAAAGVVVVGALLMVAGIGATARGQTELGLAIGVLGGALSFSGVVIGSVVLVTVIVAALSRPLRVAGVPGRMAALNALRHPRRTAATAVALLIGVTLVAMMSVGAASARATFAGELDARYPVDIAVGPVIDDTGRHRLPDEVLNVTEGVAGVGDLMPLRSSRALVRNAALEGDAALQPIEAEVHGVDVGRARDVMHAGIDDLEPGAAMVSRQITAMTGIDEGDLIQLQMGSQTIELRAVFAPVERHTILVTAADLAALDPDASIGMLWVKLADGSSAETVARTLRDQLSLLTTDMGIPVTTAGATRAEVSRVLDTMLMVVVGLLAVSVVIALIGIGNTLSLSVIERRRESATMRTLGLTRRQLRVMLAFEGVIVAAVAVFPGITLGLIYGWAGTLTAFGGVWDVALGVPWRWLAGIAGLAILAGLAASVLPGRRAARDDPITAVSAG
ncbi:ABC transporter permease [Phytoactinopolyspora limicola]|uniref:ABC transporter permease n=1 Tax=Phytoactinopolyspora limicola TaxID=2715536 RepID=UPI00140C8BD0|nr:FtsX-like permease family protein [Phytoactinopolyspora limicola]